MYSKLIVLSSRKNPIKYELHPIIRNVTDIVMLSAVLPNSQYVIHSGNNSAIINGIMFEIDVGDYSLIEIFDRITQKLRTVTEDSSFLVEQDKTSKFVTIKSENTLDFTWEFPFDSTMYRILGFSPSTKLVAVGGVLTANGLGSRYDSQLYKIDLCSPVFDQGRFSLGTIIIRRDDAVTFHQASTAECRRKRSVFRYPLPKLISFTLTITDEFGRIVDFNQVRFAIELKISSKY